MQTRPDLTVALQRLLAAMVELSPLLHRVDVNAIVVVAVSAHGMAAASVRPLTAKASAHEGDASAACARSVVIDGCKRSIELALRPPFFLQGDAPARLVTLAHELLHLDGNRLRTENLHTQKTHAALEKEARAIATAVLPLLDARAVLCLAHHGEVTLRAWKHRPIEATHRRAFNDDDVYAQPVMMVTPADRRGGWW